MVVLALDTTTRGGSVALWRDGVVELRAGDATRTHAERLPGELADIVTANGLALADIDLYAVASGPGSFTGMRVGIATIQALALVHGRLVVAISALDALAHAVADSAATSCVAAWMEAYRGEVFAALYRLDRDTPAAGASYGLEVLEAAVVGPPADLANAWGSRLTSDTLTVVGDAVPSTGAVWRESLGERVTLLDAPLLAGTLASLAACSPDAAVRPHAIVPVYVRRPDAELGRERRAVETVTPAT
jgi:tRNA threonylcarbamoyladenosine biosynthesis protein TsaB